MPSSRLARCEQVNKPTVGHVTYVPPEAAAALKMTDEADSAARDRIKELGNDAFRRSRFDEAIRMYTSALAVDDAAPVAEKATPAERSKLLSNRAAAAYGHDDYDSAAADAAAATEIDPSNAKVWHRLGGLTRCHLPDRPHCELGVVPARAGRVLPSVARPAARPGGRGAPAGD